MHEYKDGKIGQLEGLLQAILQILVETTMLDMFVWKDILEVIEEVDEDFCMLTPVFATVLKEGRPQLTELFCSQGMNPFLRPFRGKSAAIFGLAADNAKFWHDKCASDKGYTIMFDAIFTGMRKYWMRKVAGLKECDFSSSTMNSSSVWDDTGTLLERAVVTKPEFADFLIKNSEPDVASAAGATPLHRATLHNKESLMRDLIFAGLDPNAIGSMYITDDECWDHPTLADRLIDKTHHQKQYWDDKDCWEVAAMRKEPNTAFLSNCRKAYLRFTRSISTEVNDGSDPDSDSDTLIEADFDSDELNEEPGKSFPAPSFSPPDEAVVKE